MSDALVEIKGSEINIDVKSKTSKPEEFASDILKTFKADWNVKATSKAKYVVKNENIAGVIDCNNLETVKNTASKPATKSSKTQSAKVKSKSKK